MKMLRVVFPVVLLVLAACGVLSPDVTPFYSPPDPLPQGEPGQIISTEKIETNTAGVQAWRVMYHSRDLNGKDVPVTGIFAAPTSTPPEGGFPLLAIAHGTEGLAQKCAPSLDPWGLPSVAGSLLSFPDTGIVPFVKAGYAVTATDYQGLGAPGTASFLVGPTEAQNVIDSIRAVRAFPGIALNDQNFVWGHSQGGHSAAFTAQLAKGIAPEITLKGIVLSAPAVELKQLVEVVFASDKPSPVTGVAAMVAASWNQAYGIPLDKVLTQAGIDKVPGLFQDCVLGAVASFATQAPSAFYYADPTTTAPWADTLNANTPQGVLYPAPVFVAQGTNDFVIAPATTKDFVGKLCAAGNAVQFKEYPGADHLGVVQTSQPDVLAWLNTLRQGMPAPSNCAGAETPAPGATPTSALIPVSTATPAAGETPVVGVTPVVGGDVDGVIFADGDFTPDVATVAELEDALPGFLAQNQSKFNAQKEPIVRRLAGYKRQYWGEMQNGKRVIVVNAMCAVLPNWQTQRIYVSDGGDCFFTVEYDPASKTFVGLMVNGEA